LHLSLQREKSSFSIKKLKKKEKKNSLKNSSSRKIFFKGKKKKKSFLYTKKKNVDLFFSLLLFSLWLSLMCCRGIAFVGFSGFLALRVGVAKQNAWLFWPLAYATSSVALRACWLSSLELLPLILFLLYCFEKIKKLILLLSSCVFRL